MTTCLIFTCLQETLFILKNAGLFGTQAGEVYQVSRCTAHPQWLGRTWMADAVSSGRSPRCPLCALLFLGTWSPPCLHAAQTSSTRSNRLCPISWAQVVDARGGRLQNVITFPPEGAFIVDSSVEVAGDQRINFQFTSATLKLPGRSIRLPPFGKGGCTGCTGRTGRPAHRRFQAAVAVAQLAPAASRLPRGCWAATLLLLAATWPQIARAASMVLLMIKC